MVVAEEPAGLQAQHDPAPADRRICQAALVAAVHPARRASARGTDRQAGPRVSPDPHTAGGLLDALDRNGGQVR